MSGLLCFINFFSFAFFICYIILYMTINTLLKKLLKVRNDRDWQQFHNPKNLAISLSLEANEVLEHFQWLDLAQSKTYSQQHKAEIAEEMADVFNYLLLLAHDLDIDIVEESSKKLDKNSAKYPIKKSKGNSKKYTKLSS
jgi:dCTP diphosphatase